MNRILYYYLKTPFSCLVVATLANVLLALISFEASLHAFPRTAVVLFVMALIFLLVWWPRYGRRITFVSEVLKAELELDRTLELVVYKQLPEFQIIMNAFWLSTVEDLKRLKIQMDNVK